MPTIKHVTPGMFSGKIYLIAAYKVPFLLPREEGTNTVGVTMDVLLKVSVPE